MCKYCRTIGVPKPFYRNDEEDNFLLSAFIVPSMQRFYFDYDKGMEGYTHTVIINYCPFCGRSLQQEGKKNV